MKHPDNGAAGVAVLALAPFACAVIIAIAVALYDGNVFTWIASYK